MFDEFLKVHPTLATLLSALAAAGISARVIWNGTRWLIIRSAKKRAAAESARKESTEQESRLRKEAANEERSREADRQEFIQELSDGVLKRLQDDLQWRDAQITEFERRIVQLTNERDHAEGQERIAWQKARHAERNLLHIKEYLDDNGFDYSPTLKQ